MGFFPRRREGDRRGHDRDWIHDEGGSRWEAASDVSARDIPKAIGWTIAAGGVCFLRSAQAAERNAHDSRRTVLTVNRFGEANRRTPTRSADRLRFRRKASGPTPSPQNKLISY